MELEICSCPIGKNGAPCKHQFAVSKTFNVSSTQFLSVHDEEAVSTLHKIMTTIAPRPGWYAPLTGGPTALVPVETEVSLPEGLLYLYFLFIDTT